MITQENKDKLISEYKLIQDKQSDLSAKERAKICDIYKYLVKIGEIK